MVGTCFDIVLPSIDFKKYKRGLFLEILKSVEQKKMLREFNVALNTAIIQFRKEFIEYKKFADRDTL